MARDIVYLEGLWETDLLFSSYENYGNSILGHGNQENNVGDQISSLGPNIMSNENQMVQQLEAGLIGDVVAVAHGSSQEEENVGGRLEIMSSLGLINNTMSNENQRRPAQQLEAGLIWDGVMVGGHVQQENAGYEMSSSLGPNTTTCIENQMQQQLNVLGSSIRGSVDVGNIMLPHGGQNENEGHVLAQKRKGKEIMTDLENENEGRRHVVIPQKRKGKEIMTDIDLGNVGKLEKEKKKRKNTNRQPLDMETRVKIEQERRRKEAQLYADLRAMHPNLHPKAAKSRVIEETMSSIESLKQTLRSLEKQKLEMLLGLFTNTSSVEPLEPFQSLAATNKEAPLLSSSMNSNTISAGTSLNTFKTWTSSNVTLSVCGTCAVISICCLKRHGLFTTISLILKNHNLDVVSAEIFSYDSKTMYMIHVRGYVPPEFTEGFPHEKLYKKAVDQIKFCLDL